ncbi:MAG TPA: hypothetical protein VGH99_02445 [Pseudonocardia sp.]
MTGPDGPVTGPDGRNGAYRSPPGASREDLPGIGAHRYQDHPGAEKYGWLHRGPGPTAAAPGAGVLAMLADELAEAERAVRAVRAALVGGRDAGREVGTDAGGNAGRARDGGGNAGNGRGGGTGGAGGNGGGWQGAAAEAAASALDGLAARARAGAERDRDSAARIEEYAASFARLRAAVPAPGPAGERLFDGGVPDDFGVVTGLQVDHRRALLADRLREQATDDAFRAHEAASRRAVHGFPRPGDGR